MIFAWWRAVGCRRPEIRLEIVEAILLKYACNWFHALKVEFANTVGDVGRLWGADGTRVMEAFVRDRMLNVSDLYLSPGEPFGGSCLPKDLSAAVSDLGDDVPLLKAVLLSNRRRLG